MTEKDKVDSISSTTLKMNNVVDIRKKGKTMESNKNVETKTIGKTNEVTLRKNILVFKTTKKLNTNQLNYLNKFTKGNTQITIVDDFSELINLQDKFNICINFSDREEEPIEKPKYEVSTWVETLLATESMYRQNLKEDGILYAFTHKKHLTSDDAVHCRNLAMFHLKSIDEISSDILAISLTKEMIDIVQINGKVFDKEAIYLNNRNHSWQIPMITKDSLYRRKEEN